MATCALTESSYRLLPGFPNLTELDLSESAIKDEEIEPVGRCANLTRVVLHGTPVSDAGVKFLSSLVWLEVLDLSSTRVHGPGLEHLGRLPHLRELSLDRTAIGDDALGALRRMYPALRRVSLKGAQVTQTGAAELRARLRDCTVEFVPAP
jgi:internalin A